MRVTLQPDEKYLWVGTGAGVSVIDTASLKVTKEIATGAGQHEIAFGSGARTQPGTEYFGIDPLLGFGGSKLLTLILLKSPGEDWALTANGAKLFVSMPKINQVAVVDTATLKVISNVLITGLRS